MQGLSLGLYIHVPFCENACEYCHFFKKSPDEGSINTYFENIKIDLNRLEQYLKGRYIETIYIGGGTPTCLPIDKLKALCQICSKFKNPLEWSVEVSPSTATKDKLMVLFNAGVTRISMGIQSFKQKTLNTLGRTDKTEVCNAYDNIRSAGFKNINIDLIFPSEFISKDEWKNDLLYAIKLSPEHISTYCLEYENVKGKFTPQTHKIANIDNKETDFYKFTWKFLKNHGYNHYEISNFAKTNFNCKHNLSTWKMQEWLGIGPSAASQINKKRFQNSYDMDYTNKQYINVRQLTDEDLCKDCIIFGLRIIDGVNLKNLQKRFKNIDLNKYNNLFEMFKKNRFVNYDGETIKCTEKGLLIADSLGFEVLCID